MKADIPKWLQLIIMVAVLSLITLYCINMIGAAEYDKVFCESKIELKEGDKVALLFDSKTQNHGCCRVPEDIKEIVIEKDCHYVEGYHQPSLKEKTGSFLKKFK